MKLLKMKGHQCMLYALAMLLHAKPKALIRELGHNGLEKWWPEYDEPFCFRGFHIQEAIGLCLARGYALVPIEVTPVSGPRPNPQNFKRLWDIGTAGERFLARVRDKPGLLITATHACAWDGQKVYDPNGAIKKLSDYTIREIWLMLPIKSD